MSCSSFVHKHTPNLYRLQKYSSMQEPRVRILSYFLLLSFRYIYLQRPRYCTWTSDVSTQFTKNLSGTCLELKDVHKPKAPHIAFAPHQQLIFCVAFDDIWLWPRRNLRLPMYSTYSCQQQHLHKESPRMYTHHKPWPLVNPITSIVSS